NIRLNPSHSSPDWLSTQPESLSVIAKSSERFWLSWSSGYQSTAKVCGANFRRASAIMVRDCRLNDLKANRASSLTRARRSSSAILFASAARAFASADLAWASEMATLEDSRNELNSESFLSDNLCEKYHAKEPARAAAAVSPTA